ncbi:hypothetical protein M407DRAFT_245508 [Tulasnella calospora MUT 4182]|uniref:Uncharacterized protein n=1 Tax=Tulasnella calospora MUT 4182 TaxID=1051891 RepID=A0A0C3KIU6_9AGAM|nr:hypothetical protein M407DRAFT_245508 [Tulasnella calospora MUT 4182]
MSRTRLLCVYAFPSQENRFRDRQGTDAQHVYLDKRALQVKRFLIAMGYCDERGKMNGGELRWSKSSPDPSLDKVTSDFSNQLNDQVRRRKQ